jgi:hypothetical protein
MSMPGYFMVRYSVPGLYAFELVAVIAAWVLVIALWRRAGGDAKPLAVYVIGGLYDSGIELLAQGTGVRAGPDASLFGVMPIGYPLLPFVMGFFEGGILLLAGFEILRGVTQRDRRSLRTGLGVTGTLAAFIVAGAVVGRARLETHPDLLILTTRVLFSKGSVAILVLCYGVSLAYVFLARSARAADRRRLLIWYAAVSTVAAIWYTPLFVTGGRRIATLVDGAYVPVGILEQLAILYGYSIVFEAAGFYLPVYVVLRLCRLIE